MFRSRHLLGFLSLLAGSLAGVAPAVAGHPAGAPGNVSPVGPSITVEMLGCSGTRSVQSFGS
jgi:hypothetical protein